MYEEFGIYIGFPDLAKTKQEKSQLNVQLNVTFR